MIELLVVGLLQVIGGSPAEVGPPSPAPIEQTSGAAETPAPQLALPETDEPETPAPDTATPAAPAERQMRRERVCRNVVVSGRRIPDRVCNEVLVPVEPEEASSN